MRLLLGAVFIFSGFVKSADPVGTSVFVEKYLATYGMEWLVSASLYIAVALGVVELVLGVMLVLRLMLSYALLATTIFLSLFTLITLLSATLLPIGDCGCFGDAVQLTPWQTFLKNVVMLPMAIYLYRGSVAVVPTLRSFMVLAGVVIVALWVNVYAIRHLPLIDFMPYKVGLDLHSAVTRERAQEQAAVRNMLVFQDKTTGERCVFDATDVSCWEDEDLEYVDAYTVSDALPDMTFSDFMLFDKHGRECGLELLQREGVYAWLFVRDFDALYGERIDAVDRLRAQYADEHIVVVVSSDSCAIEQLLGMACYTMDAMTMRSVLRSDVGVVIIDNGVILDKRSFRDM